jgi:hypothetical protein
MEFPDVERFLIGSRECRPGREEKCPKTDYSSIAKIKASLEVPR